MGRKSEIGSVALLLLTSVLLQRASHAADVQFIEVPEAALKAMDIDRAMDLVSLEIGHYWLRSLRWTCPYVTAAGERSVDHYGVKLENLIGLDLPPETSEQVIGTIYFNYPRVARNFCRIPYSVSTKQEALDLAAAFTRLSKVPADQLREKIAARYYLDTATVSSIDRFLATEASVEIAKVLLQDSMQSLVQAGGAREFVAEPSVLPVGSKFTIAAHYLVEPREPNSIIDAQYYLLPAQAGEYEVQKTRMNQLTVCRDRNFYRAATHADARLCRDDDGATVETTLAVNVGQAAYLPAAINTTTYYEVETDETIFVESTKRGTFRNRYIRACYVDGTESLTLAAGVFDAVRFVCGDLSVRSGKYEKKFGTVWVDRNSGLPVRSTMQVHDDEKSQRYELTEEVVSLRKP